MPIKAVMLQQAQGYPTDLTIWLSYLDQLQLPTFIWLITNITSLDNLLIMVLLHVKQFLRFLFISIVDEILKVTEPIFFPAF